MLESARAHEISKHPVLSIIILIFLRCHILPLYIPWRQNYRHHQDSNRTREVKPKLLEKKNSSEPTIDYAISKSRLETQLLTA